ncbi:hypothetical protein AY601_4893 [Pedobacter cryoconitis]|uniref:Uncharacterized protein n=1 Tax=Pedobacter cryoconitis TaxID=188932 RepID=A0A127VK60_9SPHI|nr:hypothetical protein [Pedobacter cryoconitis]AMQ01714.1 hypothetical protein AY601_4893 [Pedobacter cryoconitis]
MDTNLISLRTHSLSYQHITSEFRVVRNNLVHEIEDLFDKSCKLVIIEGKEGAGKTDILLQFSEKYIFNSFTYFINPAFRTSYRLDYLMEDLGRQIYFYNKSESPPSDFAITEGVFNKLVFDLTTSPGKKNKPLYFILDGLDQIEKSDIELLKSALYILPWGTNNFYFIVSGILEELKEILPPLTFKSSKILRVPRFTENETKLLFNLEDTLKAKEFITEIHNTWKGHPENLSQVKRIIDSGISPDDFLSNMEITEKNDLLEVEWKTANISDIEFDNPIIMITSLLAFGDNIRSIDRLANILNITSEEIRTLVENVSFLTLKMDNISFVSNSYRQYSIIKLKRFEKQINAKLIEFYTTMDDINSVLNLPTLFHKNDEWNNIVDLLTIDNLDLIISNSQSFAEIKKQINYGFKASTSLKNSFENVFRFSLHRSILIGLQSSDGKKEQIKAYIHLNKSEDAFTVIANSVLKEDRLKMLVFYVQESKIAKKDIDPLIIDEIEELLNDADEGYIKENLTEIAIGLAYFLPQRAIEMIEGSLGLKQNNTSIEWLMGIISIIAKENGAGKKEDDLKIESDKIIKYSFFDKFGNSILHGINDLPEKDLIEEIEKVEKSSDRLFLLRKWIKAHSGSSGIFHIMDYSLNLLIQESSITKPSTEVLYDIVFPIKNLADPERVEEMILRIDDLMISINSPTIGKVSLELTIIQALTMLDIDRANDRTIELSKFIETISDISIKLEAYAHFWQLYKELEKNATTILESLYLDEKYLKEKLSSGLLLFLESSADQHSELESTLEVLAEVNYPFAIEVANSLNTSARRNKALFSCFRIYIKKEFSTWNLDDLEFTISCLDSEKYITECITLIFDGAFEQIKSSKNNKFMITKLLPLIGRIESNSHKCEVLSTAIILLRVKQTDANTFNARYDKLIDKLSAFLLKHYDAIVDQADKASLGYSLASTLAEYDLELATTYFTKAEYLSKDNIFEDMTHTGSLILSIRLMIRIYAGLTQKKDYSYDKIAYLINYVPEKLDQIALWAELATRIGLIGKKRVTAEIVTAKIIPTLELYKKENNEQFVDVLTRSASAIHCAQPETLLLYLKNLKIIERENIVSSTCVVLLTNCYESEPYDDLKGATHFTYQNAIEYINLLELCQDDALIHHYIRKLSNLSRLNPNNFTRVQKPEIYSKINKLIAQKLPNVSRGIKHDGYAISSKACAEQFNIGGFEKIYKEFADLEEKIKKIKNTCDRAVIYCNLATESGDNKKKKIEFLKKAFDEADQILSLTERIEMYESILELTIKASTDLFNHYLKKIEADIYNLDENDQYPSFKKLIDLAYRYDKTVAQRLISNLDTDPARKKMAEPANNHYDRIDLRKSAESDYSQIGKIKDRREKGNLAWSLLGQLNSSKRKVKDVNETLTFLHSASKMPIFYSMPLYEFFLENLIKNGDRDNLLLKYYEAANENAKLCYNLICNISNKKVSTMNYNINAATNSILVTADKKTEVFQFIRNLVENSEAKEIYIIDPYFSEREMSFIKKMDDWTLDAHVTILTSCESKGDFGRSSYLNEWTKFSAEPPPQNSYISVKNQIDKSPFHDRYMLLYDKRLGLRLGGSINGIGGNKTFEISKIVASEVELIYETIVKPFAVQRKKEINDQAIKYESFDF